MAQLVKSTVSYPIHDWVSMVESHSGQTFSRGQELGHVPFKSASASPKQSNLGPRKLDGCRGSHSRGEERERKREKEQSTRLVRRKYVPAYTTRLAVSLMLRNQRSKTISSRIQAGLCDGSRLAQNII